MIREQKIGLMAVTPFTMKLNIQDFSSIFKDDQWNIDILDVTLNEVKEKSVASRKDYARRRNISQEDDSYLLYHT